MTISKEKKKEYNEKHRNKKKLPTESQIIELDTEPEEETEKQPQANKEIEAIDENDDDCIRMDKETYTYLINLAKKAQITPAPTISPAVPTIGPAVPTIGPAIAPAIVPAPVLRPNERNEKDFFWHIVHAVSMCNKDL